MYKKLVNVFIKQGVLQTDDKRYCCLENILSVERDSKYMDVKFWYQPINPKMVKQTDVFHTYYDKDMFNLLNSYAVMKEL